MTPRRRATDWPPDGGLFAVEDIPPPRYREPEPMTRATWAADGACTNTADVDPEWFWQDEPTGRPRKDGTRPDPHQAARETCHDCPVLQQCRTWALANESEGFWGGLSAPERTELRRAARLPAPAPHSLEPYVEPEPDLTVPHPDGYRRTALPYGENWRHRKARNAGRRSTDQARNLTLDEECA